MTDSGGARFSLMWLPYDSDGPMPTTVGDTTAGATVGAIIPLDTAIVAAIGLPQNWLTPTSDAASGLPLTLCAVYEASQTPSPEMLAGTGT